MHDSRSLHTASILPNGKVLVTGGFICDGGELNSAELYDHSKGIWTRTGSMTLSRAFHTASVLSNGKVLVVGGLIDASYVSSTCELYDPTTGQWTSAGRLNHARYSHTAITLLDGKVLVVGGIDKEDDRLHSTELYDPSTGMWTMSGNMNDRRETHTTTLLPDGNVLVVGGANDSDATYGFLSSSELYNSSTGLWTNAGNMQVPRQAHTASLLNNGYVVVAGGCTTYNSILKTAELYVPLINTFISVDNINDCQLSHKPIN